MKINGVGEVDSPKTRKEVRGAIVGMVMGDGSLHRNMLSGGRGYCGHYKLDIAHSIKQRAYLEHKTKVVNALFDYELPIRERVITLKSNGKSYPAVRMCTRTHARLSFIGKNMYPEGKKRITPWVLDALTDEGVAYWYMDDGCLHIRKGGGGFVVLGTYGFPVEDTRLLADWIERRYGCRFTVLRHCKSGHYLRLGLSRGATKFLDALRPFAVESMLYKFDYSNAWTKRGPYDFSTAPAPT